MIYLPTATKNYVHTSNTFRPIDIGLGVGLRNLISAQFGCHLGTDYISNTEKELITAWISFSALINLQAKLIIGRYTYFNSKVLLFFNEIFRWFSYKMRFQFFLYSLRFKIMTSANTESS